tara:strand:+ start:12060 stop:12413 length:354 start_codon:yes stop_codon:yes gene_type:complete
MEILIKYWWLVLVIVIFITLIFKNKKNNKLNLSEFLKDKAIIVDVRSEEEYALGHVKNSKNIPLKDLMYRVNEFDKKKKIITVCALGIKAESAKKFFKSRGFEVINAGKWTNLKHLK